MSSDNTGVRYTNIRTLFGHILQDHYVQFCQKYEETDRNFILCRVCNCYIRFGQGSAEENVKARRALEMAHYFTHGVTLLQHMGILFRKSDSQFNCNLCQLTSLHKSL